MKHRGCVCDFADERDKDLLRSYRKLLEESGVISSEIYVKLVDMPSARFWVSEERAAIVVASMMNGDKLTNQRQNKREMYQEIYRRVMLLKRKKTELSLYELVSEVVRQPAPKFYITPGSAEVYICYAKKKWYEERRKKLRHLFY